MQCNHLTLHVCVHIMCEHTYGETMTDIREAVARAIAEKRNQRSMTANVDRGITEGDRADADAAIAAHIEAIMVPSKEVIDAGITAAEDAENWTTDTNETYRCDASSDLPLPVWQAMITAMRNEK